MTSEYSLPEEPSTSSLPNNSDDYSDKVGSWLRNCLQLAESSSNQVIISKFQELDAYWRLPSFRLAVVGEANRGKSTFINHLLGRSILPAHDYPTTGTITSIIAGSEERMEVCFTDGKRETRSLEESSWNDLLAINQVGDDQELSVAEVQVTVNNLWLKAIDIELIDTPAAGNISSYRSALLSKLLGQCDATVLVVSANIPFSENEAAFLEKEVVGQHIPRILIVISKLDTLSQENRIDLLKIIRDRVAKVSDKVPVLPLHPVKSVMAQDEVFKEVLTKIEELVRKENRRVWRSQKIALEIIDYLSHLMKIGEETISALEMNAAERENALKEINLEISKVNLEWERIKIELNRRRMQHSQNLRQEIDAEKAEFLNSFLKDLNGKQDFKLWWEETLPTSLRHLLVILDQKIEQLFINNLHQDYKWLQIEVEQVLNVNMVKKSFEFSGEVEISPDIQPINLTGMKQRILWEKVSSLTPRFIEVLGTGLFAPVVLTTNPPLAISIAALSVALAEGIRMILKLPNKMIISEQRNLVAKELEKVLEKIFLEYFNSIDEHFCRLYEQVVEQTRKEQNAWVLMKKSILNNNYDYDENQIKWKQLITDTYCLKKNILNALIKNTI